MSKTFIKIVTLIACISFLLILSSCENLDLNKVDLNQFSDKDLKIISDKGVICDLPYIRVGLECCLDSDKNSICDNQNLNSSNSSNISIYPSYDISNLEGNSDSGEREGRDNRFSNYNLPFHQSRISNNNAAKTSVPLGVNLAGPISYYSSEWVFLDMMKSSSNWLTQIEGNWEIWDTEEQNKLDLDESGWVKSLTPLNNQEAEYDYVATYLMASNYHPSGRYIVLYDGEGRVEYRLNGIKNQELSMPGRDVIEFNDPSLGGLLLMIKETDPNNNGNYIRNIRIISPGGICNNDIFTYHKDSSTCDGEFVSFEDIYDSLVFHPKFLSDMKNYRVVRFMQFFDITNSPPGNWDDRVELSDARWSGRDGAPVDIAFKLSNVLGVDNWVNIPYSADDNYVTEMATLAKESLKDQTVYVEYTNEIWNGAYPYSIGGNWVTQKAREEWPDAIEDDFTIKLNWYGKRSTEICRIWKEVWDEESNRINCVVGSQIGLDYVHQNILSCPIAVRNGFDSCSKDIDSLGIAPYFGGYLMNDDFAKNWASQRSDGMTNLFNALQVDIRRILDYVEEDYNFLNRTYPNIDLVAYEGGQHLAVHPRDHRNVDLVNFFKEAQTDPRMKNLYLDLLNGWKNIGGKLFVHYSSVQRDSVWGNWGYKEWQEQTVEHSPKFDALLEFSDRNPCWWEGCTSNVDRNFNVPEVEESICGNNLLETSEGCDDGNSLNNDGCSSNCEIEDRVEVIDQNNLPSDNPQRQSSKSIVLSQQWGNHLIWQLSGFDNSSEFLVLFSKNQDLTYPPLTGGMKYHRGYNVTDVWINPYDGSGNYYVRVCEYLPHSNSCGEVYSNIVSVEI